MFLRIKDKLKILSHPNIVSLNHHDSSQFLVIFFDELRSFLINLHHYSEYEFIFSNNAITLHYIKNFWVSLSSCSLTSESKDNTQYFVMAEKNIFIIYRDLHEFRKKYSITLIEKLFHALHLVVQHFYPKEAMQKISFSCSQKIIAENEKNFYPLKIMLQDPVHSIFVYESEACKKEFSSLFFLFRKSDFSEQVINSLRQDIFLTTKKYPLAQHDKILDDFVKISDLSI